MDTNTCELLLFRFLFNSMVEFVARRMIQYIVMHVCCLDWRAVISLATGQTTKNVMLLTYWF